MSLEFKDCLAQFCHLCFQHFLRALCQGKSEHLWARRLNRGCPYSSDKCCILETHKSPKCIAYICSNFTRALNEKGMDYDWFETHTLLISILNDASFDWWSGAKIESCYISDEEFSAIKRQLEKSLDIGSEGGLIEKKQTSRLS